MAEVDLDVLDKSWDEEGEPDEPDVDALDGGWDHPRRSRTTAEKAVARKEKARTRVERQRARAAAAAQKQKQKQKKPGPPARGAPRTSASEATSDSGETNEPHVPATFGWSRMMIAIAIIIAI